VGEDADKPPVALIPERAPVEIICAACVLSQHGVKVVVMLGHVDDGLGDAARRLAYFGGIPSAFQVQVRVAADIEAVWIGKERLIPVGRRRQ
jgi:hypothetical protein